MKVRVALLALAPLLFVPFLRADGEVKAPKAPAALEKVAIVGASVSAGVGLDPTSDPLQGQESKLRLAHVVEASIVGAHGPLVDLSDYMFFSAPKPTAKRRAKEAVDAKPSVLVAIDFLFWLGYGPGSEKARLERVDEGLKALEGVKGPILLGDLADFNGVQVSRMMLAPEAIPPKEVLEKLNARIAEWAKGHKNVTVVPIREMFRKVNAGEEFEIHGNKFDKGARARLMQDDGLHTTIEGTCALWVLAVDTWLATKPAGLDDTAFVLDVAGLAEKAPGVVLADPKDARGKAKEPKKKEKAGAGG